jgi:hypothetical protein
MPHINDTKGEPFWEFDGEGDVLRGVLVDHDFADWTYHDGREDRIPLAHIRTAEGTAPLWCWHAVLRKKLFALNPQHGKLVEIALGREVAKRDGTSYYLYKVSCPDRREPNQVNWAAEAAGAAPQLPPGPVTEGELPVEGTARDPVAPTPEQVHAAHREAKRLGAPMPDDVRFEPAR